jgi:hypothetical protein
MTTPPPPPPGWYPDPGGTNTQRYFDGNKWTDHHVPFNQPSGPATPAAARKKRKWPWIALGVVVFLFIVGHSCGRSDQGKNTGTAATATSPAAAAAGPAMTTTTTTTQGPQPPRVQGLRWDVQPGPDGDIVTAKFKIGENLTNGLSKDGARIDTMNILKYAQQAYPNLAEVHVDGSADMVDQYGNTKDEQVVTLTYTRATVNKINWDGLDFHNMWNIADSAEVHPAFQY